jgi:CheY-like chemotaxis protein
MSGAVKKKILLIDDEEGFTTLVKIQLEAAGPFEVRVVNESPLAFEIAKEFRPDVILLDVVMPEMDGGDISALLKQDAELRDVPVIVITALSSGEDEGANEVPEANLKAGDRVVLSKPVRTERLISTIERVMAA